MFDPFASGAALGEVVPRVEALGQLGERLVVVAGLADRVERTGHRDQVAVAVAATDVVALERRGDRQHDVGVTGGGGPERLVHHDRVGPGERSTQPVEVLVVVERVAARPVHEADVGQAQPLAVVVERAAGVLEQLADLGDRDERVDRIASPAGERGNGCGTAARRPRPSTT